MEAVVEFERRMTGASVFCIIMGKYSHWELPCLVILFEIDKNTEIDLHDAILPFNLVISLRVKSDRQFSLNFQELAECTSKL